MGPTNLPLRRSGQNYPLVKTTRLGEQPGPRCRVQKRGDLRTKSVGQTWEQLRNKCLQIRPKTGYEQRAKGKTNQQDSEICHGLIIRWSLVRIQAGPPRIRQAGPCRESPRDRLDSPLIESSIPPEEQVAEERHA